MTPFTWLALGVLAALGIVAVALVKRTPKRQRRHRDRRYRDEHESGFI